jgi:hypothetical protein
MKTNTKQKIFLGFLLVFLGQFVLESALFQISNRDTENSLLPGGDFFDHPLAADVSGNELYAEQISVNIAGDVGLIQQTLLTNDTNIFAKLDLSDPAFVQSAFMIQVSNGITPALHPLPSTTTTLHRVIPNFKTMSGFLYYSNQSSLWLVHDRRDRAINILENIFQLDFILLDAVENASIGYYYPFFGAEPIWETYFDTTLSNIPDDGYWSILNTSRITSTDYLTSQHLSSQIFFLKRYSMLTDDLPQLSNDNLALNFDLSMLASDNIMSGLLSVPGSTSDFTVGNNVDDAAEEESFLESLENILSYSIQYEAPHEAFTQTSVSPKTFEFDLLRALETESTLQVSDKTFNSVDGIMVSSFDVSFYSAEILQVTPEYIPLEKANIERIESLMFLFDDTTDLSMLKDLSFQIAWKSQDLFTKMVSTVVDLKNASNPINLLSLFSSTDAGTGLPSSMIEPVSDFRCTYQILNSEPSLFINKTLTQGNASRIMDPDSIPQIEIYVENQGDSRAWGIESNLTSMGLTNDPLEPRDMLGQPIGSFFELLGYDTEAIVEVTTTLGYDINDLFHDDNARFFNIDSNNTGSADIQYPEILPLNTLNSLNNLGNITDILDLFQDFISLYSIYPYSPAFSQLLIDNPEAYGDIADDPQAFNASESIFNPDNWKLEPGESFALMIPDLLAENNYTTFHSMFVADLGALSPIVSIGSVVDNTDISGTYLLEDGETWNSASMLLDTNRIEHLLTFQNTTSVDAQEKKFDALSIEMHFINSDNDTEIAVEIFDFVNQSFIPVPNAYSIETPEIINITLIPTDANEYNISHYFDASNNYAVFLRLNYQNGEIFEVAIDYLAVHFLDLDYDLLFVDQASITYTVESGSAKFLAYSNSMTLGTDDLSVLTAYAEVVTTVHNPGDLVRYNLTIINIGNQKAVNISIEIDQPGIIFPTDSWTWKNETNHIIQIQSYNFSLSGNILSYQITELDPGQQIGNLTFGFYLPNSKLLPAAIIRWNDANSSLSIGRINKTAKSNQLYLSAPVNYQSHSFRPDFHHIEVKFLSTFHDSIPKIDDQFTIEISIKNLGRRPVYGLQFQFGGNQEGLYFANSSDISIIAELGTNETRIVQVSYIKTSVHGYMLPPITLLSNLDCNYISLSYQPVLVIGQFDLEITKEFSSFDLAKGGILEISVIITNRGNIEVGDLTLNDDFYDSDGFTIYQGKTVHSIDYLSPGESIIFTYKLVALRQQGIFTINPAQIQFCFIYKQIITSEPTEIKIRTPYWIITLSLLGPISIGGSVLIGVYKYKLGYSREELEMERREALMFGQDLREISWKKKNIIEFLDEELASEGSL